jgi:spermidine synthase
MARPQKNPFQIYALVVASGFATLSWEVIWQIKISLALGISAWGSAITIAVTMGGLSLGSYLSGRLLKDKSAIKPFRLYGILELVIGVCGLLLGISFLIVENIDTAVYAAAPGFAPLVYIAGIIMALMIPTLCMGATLPVFGLIATQYRTSIATLYCLNTLGAALGALLAAFLLIPLFGITHTCWVIAAVNFIVALSASLLGKRVKAPAKRAENAKPISKLSFSTQQYLATVTGFATFALEIIWFRSFSAAFYNTTDAFAIMLAAVLVSIGLAAAIAPMLKKIKISLGVLLSIAGILTLLITPVIERFDSFVDFHIQPPIMLSLDWFMLALSAIGLPAFTLSIAFPWILDDQRSPRHWGRLYALNTLAAIAGSIGAAWVLLPFLGLARSSWLVGSIIVVSGIAISTTRSRKYCAVIGALVLLIAMVTEDGLGRTNIEGHFLYGKHRLKQILDYFEGPEATVSAIEYDDGGRALIVDGFITASEFGTDARFSDRYMDWMGHLPMLLHPDPKNALVICFGTGQTANAVRRENPQSLDIVDINPRIYKLAHNFDANQNVLGDPRVTPIVMDGRSYMRRTTKTYDVITLEPMPPNFAGVNALYSQKFYQLARDRLSANGIIAQWVPFHLVEAYYAASIARTFQSVFPNSILWIDPSSKTGILLGSKGDDSLLGSVWPGFERNDIPREYSEDEIRKDVYLNPVELQHWAAHGEIITDDNQLLAYGEAVSLSHNYGHLRKANTDLLNESKAGN